MQQIALEEISSNLGQPRKSFYEDTLKELAQSIKERGVLEPIVVRPIKGLPNGAKYQIVMGERRFRATRIAGLKTIPAIIKTMNDEDAQADALLENFQREDLNPIEKARAIGPQRRRAPQPAHRGHAAPSRAERVARTG